MSPLKRSNNFAARMGRWSASHWKTAVFGWLAFVIAAFVIGNALGTKYLEDGDFAVGETKKADTIIEAGFPANDDKMGEIVLIQSDKLKVDDPRFKAVVADVTRTLEKFPRDHGARVARQQRQPGPDLEGSSRRSWSPSPRRATSTRRRSTSTRSSTQSIRCRDQHDDFYVAELGSVSTEKAMMPRSPACSRRPG